MDAASTAVAVFSGELPPPAGGVCQLCPFCRLPRECSPMFVVTSRLPSGPHWIVQRALTDEASETLYCKLTGYSAAICGGSSSFEAVTTLVSGRGAISTIGGVSRVFALPAPRVSKRLAWVSTWLSKLPTIWL
jgi:hypothetical protein